MKPLGSTCIMNLMMKSIAFSRIVFCGVVRPQDHPMRPADYVPLDNFWRNRGYEKMDGVVCEFPWRDIGDAKETRKPMQFWTRRLADAD